MKSNEWATPQDFFDKINAVFGFTLDAAASAENAKCKHYFDKKVNGLDQSWADHKVWVNPPYSHQGIWCRKMYMEARRHGITIVGLIMVRTDRQWWHQYVTKADFVIFLRGRLKFVECGTGRQSSSPFWNALVVYNWNGPYDELQKIGALWTVIRPKIRGCCELVG